MTASIIGAAPATWEGDIDEEGHQTFAIMFLVEVDSAQDGPWVALNCPDLPACGDPWDFGNDFNPRAYAGCARKAKRHQARGDAGDPGKVWAVTVPYSTRAKARCCDELFDDPLAEPPRVKFSVDSEKEEATTNYYGSAIETSSHEQIHGPKNEWDRNDFKVTITQNLLDPQLPLLIRYLDQGGAVNDSTLWDFPARCVRLCEPMEVEETYFGSCLKYYKRTLTFHIKASTHDRIVADEGTKALNGHWGLGQGDGATVNLTVNANGEIQTATLASGGSGYPRSGSVFLVVDGGVGGIVQAKTNSSGVVTEVTVYQGGYNYLGGGPANLNGGGGGWILDDVIDPCDGSRSAPDPDNPAHFSRYVDQTGNPATVRLDGHGVPYSPCRAANAVSWWCLDADVFGTRVVNETCDEAVAEARSIGATVSGPYNSEAAADAACAAGTGGSGGQDPDDVDCPSSAPGEILIERCPPEDLTLLGIPLVIGAPGP